MTFGVIKTLVPGVDGEDQIVNPRQAPLPEAELRVNVCLGLVDNVI